MSRTALPGIELREFTDGDLAFLARVYAASRHDEMAMIPEWSQAQKDHFLQRQFQAQHHHYLKYYPDASYRLIIKEGEEIGRLYIARMNNEIRLMDIALLTAYRGHGIGSGLVRELMEDADRSRKYISLHVEAQNPAKRLYQRLGFTVVGEVGVYQLMHWIPEGLTQIYPPGWQTSSDNQVNTAS